MQAEKPPHYLLFAFLSIVGCDWSDLASRPNNVIPVPHGRHFLAVYLFRSNNSIPLARIPITMVRVATGEIGCAAPAERLGRHEGFVNRDAR